MVVCVGVECPLLDEDADMKTHPEAFHRYRRMRVDFPGHRTLVRAAEAKKDTILMKNRKDGSPEHPALVMIPSGLIQSVQHSAMKRKPTTAISTLVLIVANYIIS